MEILVPIYVCLVIFTASVGAKSARLVRHKRNLIQLGEMIDCTETRHDFIDYNGYGCWCGIGGSGTPLDESDTCCRSHDRCYDRLPASVGGPCLLRPQMYTALYQHFACNSCSDASAYDHWWYKILLASPQCRMALCHCDSLLVRCLLGAERTFHPEYRYYYKRITACDSLLPWLPMPLARGMTGVQGGHPHTGGAQIDADHQHL